MAKSEHDPESFPALAGHHARGGGGEDCSLERFKRISEFSESIKREESRRWIPPCRALGGNPRREKEEWWRWLSLQPENLSPKTRNRQIVT